MIHNSQKSISFHADLVPGDVMPDGTMFVGISPSTKRPTFAVLSECSNDAHRGLLQASWADAKAAATQLRTAGHSDWRIPTAEELGQLYALQRGLRVSRDQHADQLLPVHPLNNQSWASCYWSSQSSLLVGAQTISAKDGAGYTMSKKKPRWPVALQCVRG